MIFKFLSKIFKTKEEPTFSASIQRVPSTQVSLDTTEFDWVTGSNVFDGFQSLDNEINTLITEGLSSQIDSSNWDSAYSTVLANSAILWDNTELSARTLTLELSSDYFSQELSSLNTELFEVSGNLYSFIDTTSAITLSSANSYTTNLVESISSDLNAHIDDTSIHFLQNDISISASQISDFPSNISHFTNDSNFISSVSWGDIQGDLTNIYISSLSADNITLNNIELTSEVRTLTSVSVTPDYLIVRVDGNERALRLFEF
jgi:hypothetical protein